MSIFLLSVCHILGIAIAEPMEVDIFEAARTGNETELLRIVNTNSDTVNSINEQGYTPLVLATYYGNYNTMKLLIEYGASINYSSSQGTALCGAAYKGDSTATNILLRNNANPNIGDQNGTTPLLFATLFSHTEVAILLCSKGALPSIADNEGLTPVKCAEQLKNDKLIELYKNALKNE